MAEFLPLCDVLFNVISLAGYFCDVVFDVVMGYALLERGYKATFAAAMSIIVTSLVISQILSWRWYYGPCAGDGRVPRGVWAPAALHCLQLGVLWRYARLFVPVDPRHVKHQVRDLCMLRLVHAFAEAAPMLLLQLHVLLAAPPELDPPPDGEPVRDEPAANKAFAELNVISASLSLFSVCWALASFSKNVRLQNVHRLVLTWLGVIFQFLWRLGTISARMCALTVYALAYEYWVFLVIGLHWVSMFLWLISPKNVFHGERISKPRKAYLSALIAFVYVFAYVNLQELNHRQKMVTFYCVMCVENCLLVGAWAAAGRAGAAGGAAPLFTLAAQAAGLLFMRAYYRYFHVRRLGYMLRENQQGTNSTNASSQNKNGKHPGQGETAAIPGVFNCRFSNPVGSAANGRKKKKPTSFVPPPAAPAPAPATAPAPAPAAAFWRRPLPTTHNHHGGSSENEGSSVGSRVNIQQKLQEKKQKQLAELRVIEEEIKQGKLTKTAPVAVEEIYSSLQRQPIPRAKTHAEPPAWPRLDVTHSYQNYPVLPHTCNVYPTYTEIKTFDFQSPVDPPNTEINDPLKTRRPPRSHYAQDRTLYENPANIRGEVNRTPLRTNYLAIGETRNYEGGCGSPRNVLDSPRGYPDASAPLDKPRLPQTEFYCESNNQSVYKDEYVNGIEGIRTYTEGNNRLGYGLPGKGKLEQLRLMQRCRTPEILLAPHYLEGCGRQLCCHWGGPAPYNVSRKKEEGVASSGEGSAPDGAARETPRPPSDIESQISLPRSYTLPREFRYWRRRPRTRDARAPSNNSSDGDVDSGDESDRRSSCSAGSARGPAGRPGARPGPARSQDEERRGLALDRRRAPRKLLPKPETKL